DARAVAFERVQVAYHFLELAVGGRRWRPEVGLLLGAVISDGQRILTVGLVALHDGFTVLLDELGIDDTNRVSLLMEEQGQLHPVAAGGFQAGMDLAGAPLL